MKDSNRLFLWAVGLLTVMVLVTVWWSGQNDTKQKGPSELPRLCSDEEVQKAAKGPTRRYLVEGATLTGQATEDPLNILSGEYLSITYSCEQYSEQTGYDTDGHPTSYWQWVRKENWDLSTASEAALLAGTALDTTQCQYDRQFFLSLDQETCLPRAWSRLENNYYYPQGIGNEPSNIRYHLVGAPMGAHVTLLADIGADRAVVAKIDDSRRMIVVDGTAEDLLYYTSEEATGLMAMTWVFGMPLDVALWFFAFRAKIKERLQKRKAKRQDTNCE